MNTVDLSKIVCDNFRGVFNNIVNCEMDTVVMNGGRNSTKSQVASEAIIVGCMVHKASAVAIIKHANKIEERLVNTFRDSLEFLGVKQYWKLRRSPFEYVLLDDNGKETDISIKFTGADDPEMLKSYKPRSGGGFRYVWFEEVTNFTSYKEVNNIVLSMARGQGEHCVIMTYNPPKATSNWVNKEFNAPCGKVLGYDSDSYIQEVSIEVNGEALVSKQLIHHSTYLDVIKSGHSNWLGKVFLGEAEKARINNNSHYRWAYLGEVVGTSANVFSNVIDWSINNKSSLILNKIDRGLDCSNGGPDPWAYGEWYFDKIDRKLYCLAECKRGGTAKIEDVADSIKLINPKNLDFYIDSAVPTFSKLLGTAGVKPIPVKKGPDSVRAGVIWLQSLNGIYIDRMNCPNTYAEFKNYEWFIDKDDEITNELVDKDNHFIDACRYAESFNIKYE